jgi:glutamine synthetase
LLWVDTANVRRCKIVPRRRFTANLWRHGVGVTRANHGSGVFHDGPVNGQSLTPVGEVRLVPDLSSLVELPYARGHAAVCCDIAACTASQPFEPWEHCARSFLRAQIAALARDYHVEPVIGFEVEFYLVRVDTGAPAASDLYGSTLSVDREHTFLTRLVDTLETQGSVAW